MEGFWKGVGAVIVTIIGGVIVWWLTTSPDSPFISNEPTARPPVVSTARPQSFMERLAGNYELISWSQASSPISFGIGIKEGTLEIDSTGNADWDLGVWDRAANPSVPATITARTRCGGRVSTQSQQIEWVYDSSRNHSSDWPLHWSTVEFFPVFCGGNSPGTNNAPFSLTLDEQSNGTVILEMSNSEGTFRWTKNG